MEHALGLNQTCSGYQNVGKMKSGEPMLSSLCLSVFFIVV